MALTYDTLKQQILTYAQKEAYDLASGKGDKNFTEAIPFFVNLALEKINRDVHTFDRNVVKHEELPLSYIIDKPSGWMQTISLYIGDDDLKKTNVKRTPLFKRSYEFCKNFIGPETGTPVFYSDTDNEKIIIVPAPVNKIYYELIYEKSFFFSNNVGELNQLWVMQKYPSLVFYASYMEALRYMGKGDEIPLYQGLYDEVVKSINVQNILRNVDRTATLEKA